MAKRSKKKKRQRPRRDQQATSAARPSKPASEPPPPEEQPSAARAPGERDDAPPSRSWLKRIAAIVLLTGAAAATAIYLSQRIELVELVTPANERERCASCHPEGRIGDQPHPAVKGHPRITKFGCTPCHGGIRRSLDKIRAHLTLPSAADQAFLPRPFFQAGCARCHIIGNLIGAEALAAGQREYLAAGCVACHAPGRRIPGVGVDLTTRPPRTIADLRRRMVDPRQVLSDSKMWTLRDRTYRKRYAATPAGEKRLQELLTYVLALIRLPVVYRAAWAKRSLAIKADCQRCHDLKRGGAAEGKKHRCALLIKQEDLRCSRCHRHQAKPSSASPQAARCPQVHAFAPLCRTCHLRHGEGLDALIGSASVVHGCVDNSADDIKRVLIRARDQACERRAKCADIGGGSPESLAYSEEGGWDRPPERLLGS